MKLLSIGACLLSLSSFAFCQVPESLGAGLQPTYSIADLPNDMIAVDITTTRDNLSALMMMSFGGGNIVAPGEQRPTLDREFLFQLINVVWTSKAQFLGNGEYMLGYKLDVPMLQRNGAIDVSKIRFRFTYTRRQAIVSMTQRDDFSPSILREMAKEPAKPVGSAVDRTITVSNLKQVGTGLMILLSDYDDIFPYVQSTPQLFKFLEPYTKNQELFRTKNPMGGEFRFNMSLAGVSVTEIESPAETPMVFESEAWPDGRRAVCFTDSHVKVVTKEEWDKMQPYLKLKLKRNGKPIPPGAAIPPPKTR